MYELHEEPRTRRPGGMFWLRANHVPPRLDGIELDSHRYYDSHRSISFLRMSGWKLFSLTEAMASLSLVISAHAISCLWH